MVLQEPLASNIGFDFITYTKRIFMKKTLPILFLLAFTLCSVSIFAQRIVVIDPSTDLTKPKDIYPVIMGDTLAGGVRKDVNTIYKLKNGSVYVLSAPLVNKSTWTLHIEATDLANVKIKPYLTRIPNASGAYPNYILSEGNLTLKNLWMVTAERGPAEEHENAKFIISGANTRVIIDNCIIEKDRGGLVRLGANNTKVYVTNCQLRNGGNRKIFQGNGRAVDARTFYFDTLIVKNTLMHNLVDRVFRSMGATARHNYLEFDQNTVFNIGGRHGSFQFGKVKEVKFTNNLLINPLMMGTVKSQLDEQTQPDKEAKKIFTIDTLYTDAKFTFASNNIFFTEDVLNIFNANDTVDRPAVYSKLLLDKLGSSAASTYFEEPLKLNNVPINITQLIIDIYKDITSKNMFDFIVEDIAYKGTPWDFGNLFDFSKLDPCVPSTTKSAKASTTGGPIGVLNFCAVATSNEELAWNNWLKLSINPNPISGSGFIEYELPAATQVDLSIYNLMGQRVLNIVNQRQDAGSHKVNFSIPTQFSAGMYIGRLVTEKGTMSSQIIVR
jgi:hypothetical protein